MRKDIPSAAALLLALSALLVALPACVSHSSTRSTSATSTESNSGRSLVLIDAKTGALDISFPDAYGATSVIADGSGGWFVGGSIKRVGETARNGLAHLSSDGNLDPTFVPDMPGHDGVYSILLHGKVLFVPCNTLGVIALDARTGKRLWRVSTNRDRVTSLAYWKGVLYVGGAFKHIGGARRSGIAAIDPATGKPTSWHVRTSGIAASNVMAIDNGVIYLSGGFNSVDGNKRLLGVAAIVARTGRVTPWIPRRKNGAGYFRNADSILVTHGQVIIGSVDEGFAAFSTRTGYALHWPERLEGNVWALAVSGDTVFLGGSPESGFYRVGGKPAHSLASVVLPKGWFTNWRPNLGSSPGIYGLAVSGPKVLAAGHFSVPGDDEQ
jgi:outer membrane protein assembly factor BamB